MLTIGTKQFNSRLFLGTGKYSDYETQLKSVEASETDVLTFAVRRMDIYDQSQPNLLQQLDLSKYTLFPNTAGAKTADEAVKIARLANASNQCDMIKVEVIGCDKTLLPDPIETIEACKVLLDEGYIVCPYVSDDVVLAKRLEALGVHAIMPAASPIGSGLGILNPVNLKFIIDQSNIPVIVDAGLGTPSDAAYAMELGADAVLLNSAVAHSDDPVRMAEAFKLAVQSGRLAHLAGRIPKRLTANASSPSEGLEFL
ncbi:thiazole synthase [Abyssicoccus albus]|uniref:thiazole synthase n=1 Tax=Abyssicoccus albus TaxID=1817405 RepID=UPI00097E240E|nr:thiazole synthase [Abyssicoccus albus]AQL55666.1 thiazole synthase [Abyssicoccus albus]